MKYERRIEPNILITHGDKIEDRASHIARRAALMKTVALRQKKDVRAQAERVARLVASIKGARPNV